MDLGLKGKVVIVTGGAKGIGSGISEAFAREGANVAIVYRSDPDYSEAFAAGLSEKYGVQCIGVMADVTDPGLTDCIFDTVREKLGPVDILINNANAGAGFGSIEAVEYEDWRKGIKGSLHHMFFLNSRFIRDCKAEGRGGNIINLSAKSAFMQNGFNKNAYVTGKGGVAAMTRAMAKELTPFGIRVNSIVPGYVLNSKGYQPGTPAYEEKAKFLPTGEYARPIEIGNIVVFLCSDMACQIIGALVDVSGGTMV